MPYIIEWIHWEKRIESKKAQYKHLFDAKASINPKGITIK